MQTVITTKLINAVSPKEKPFEIRDTQLKGLLLRVQPSGIMAYYVEYSRGKRVKLGRADAITPFQAREQAKITLSDFYNGEDPIAKKRAANVETFADFLDNIYKDWLITNLKTGQKTYDRLKQSFPEFQKLKLNEIGTFQVEKWRAQRIKDGLKSTSINRELGDLKACFSRIAQWNLLKDDSLMKVKPCRTDSNTAPRYLKPEEEARLLKTLDTREDKLRQKRESHNQWREERGYSLYSALRTTDFADHLKPSILISLHTGLRRGELFSLKWSDIDLNSPHPMLTVRGANAKSGKTRQVPLNKEAWETLKRWKSQQGVKSTFVFTGKDGQPFNDVRSSWDKVVKEAKINDFRWHDLRHTFASKLVQAGVDLNVVRELMGHSDFKMTLRYAFLAPQQKAEAVSRLENRPVQTGT